MASAGMARNSIAANIYRQASLHRTIAHCGSRTLSSKPMRNAPKHIFAPVSPKCNESRIDISGLHEREPCFDPAVHLQLEPPEYVKMLPQSGSTAASKGDIVQFPIPVCSAPDHLAGMTTAKDISSGTEVPFGGLAYSAPFRVLSDEGVAAMRGIISDHEASAEALPSRAAKSLRGLGYKSQFVHDFNYSESMLGHLSKIAGTPIGPHHMGMNMSQINFGEIGAGKPIDEWHLDSVPYVLVVLLSDASGSQGGQLQVALLGDPRETIDKIKMGVVDTSEIDVVDYPGAGYAIFMQGSRIAHAVSPVVAAREPRITCINSYQSLNPFSTDRTVYATFRDTDGHHAPVEFARHVGWRVQGQLDYMMHDSSLQGNDAAIAQLLDDAAAELKRAGDFVGRRAIDERPYKVKDQE